MLRASPVSLNAISYNAVIRSLEIIRDGRIPESKDTDETTNSGNFSSEQPPPVSTISKLMEPPIVTDIFIDTVGDPAYYKSRLVQALGYNLNCCFFFFSSSWILVSILSVVPFASTGWKYLNCSLR